MKRALIDDANMLIHANRFRAFSGVDKSKPRERMKAATDHLLDELPLGTPRQDVEKFLKKHYPNGI